MTKATTVGYGALTAVFACFGPATHGLSHIDFAEGTSSQRLPWAESQQLELFMSGLLSSHVVNSCMMLHGYAKH